MSIRYADGAGVLVTVAMPIYNAGAHLRLAVLSIVQQTFTRWELLIIDDGSTDDALQGIADICDERIQIFRDGRNRGLAARLNEACRLASGRYLARMDQDDVSYPERFARQVQVLQDYPGIDLVATRAVTIDEDNHLVGIFPLACTHAQICEQPWRGFVFPHPTWMGHLEWFLRYRYAEPAPYLCEDQELLLRSFRQSRFLTLDEVLFAYRIRRVPDWRKLAKTRRAVLAMQAKFFVASAMWGQLLLAGASYLVKTGVDLAQRLGPARLRGAGVADESVSSGWLGVLDRLRSERR